MGRVQQRQVIMVHGQVIGVVLVLFYHLVMVGEAQVLGRDGCRSRCGNVDIPFPFGIGSGCYANEAFEIVCNNSVPTPMTFLKDFGLEVTTISAEESTVEVKMPINQTWTADHRLPGNNYNPFTITDTPVAPVIMQWELDNATYQSLFGNGTSSFSGRNSTSTTSFCLGTNVTNRSLTQGFQCHCRNGFQGNPYLAHGCGDINECEPPDNPCGQLNLKCQNLYGGYRCYTDRTKTATVLGLSLGFGLLLLFIIAWRLYKFLKRRRNKKLRERYFKRNGGVLLQEKLSSGEANIDKIKMFSSKELDKSTDHYNENRMLGQGGQGTVYKGMLTDGRIVAVKKSKHLNEEQIRQFINEVVILSQINHRNVVKLLGCCLETKYPLLVYEFIPNGNLFELLHRLDQQDDEIIPLTWDMRVRIATEVASALSYLHSSASIPIYHRDIKSSNILLDDKYRAKIADFGISRSIRVDQTHVTTLVQGTFGYLDPEYFRSGQFTDKSDVYSFGVVLAELLTGQKPILCPSKSEDQISSRGLVAHFILSMEENRLFDILDAQVMKQAKKEHVVAVANLARKCLNLTGRQRPSMREVTMELERFQKLQNTNSNIPLINYTPKVGYDGRNIDHHDVKRMEQYWQSFSDLTENGFDSYSGTIANTTTSSSMDAKLLPHSWMLDI